MFGLSCRAHCHAVGFLLPRTLSSTCIRLGGCGDVAMVWVSSDLYSSSVFRLLTWYRPVSARSEQCGTEADRGCLTMNTRRFEELFYRFSLRPSLVICERFSRHSLAILPPFSRHSLAILPPFRCNSPAFQIHFVALSRDFLSHI